MGTVEKDKSEKDKPAPIGGGVTAAALAQVMDGLPDAILLLDEHWKFIYANATARHSSRIASADLVQRDLAQGNLAQGNLDQANIGRKTLWELYPELAGTGLEQFFLDAAATRRVQRVDGFCSEPFETWSDLRIIPIASGGLAVRYQHVDSAHMVRVAREAMSAQLQDVLEATTDCVVSVDREWRITYMNQRARDLLAPQEDIIGTNFLGTNLWESFPDALYEGSPYVEHYYRAMNEGVAGEFEASYPDPLNIWLTILARPAKDGIILFFRDVTERRRQEDALRASEERYRVLTELSPQALWTADAEGRVLYANQRFLEYIGKDFVPRDGMEYLQCFYEGDRQRVFEVWSHSVTTGEDYAIDARLLRARDGAARWWHLRALPLRDGAGAITQWLGMAADVHESRMAAEQLRAQFAETERQKREVEAIYRGSPIGMALYEPTEFRLLRINNRQAEILGLSPEEALGKKIEDLVPGMTASHDMIRKAATGEPILNQDIEGVLPTRPREYRHWNVNYSPIFAEDGSVQAIAGATIEVTQQKRGEAALMQSEKLAAVGRLASSIAHEINNPLEAVTNLIYLARQHCSGEAKSLLETADQELRRVSIIANQTLRFHKQATRQQAIGCEDLFSTVLTIYEGRFRNSSITVEKRNRASEPVVCFEGEIRQVLNNLVSNAIDAMPMGGRLLVRSRPATDWRSGRKGLVLTVADTGSGIDRETQRRMFEPFYTTKGISGTGLGLWISTEIMERHQGTIKIRSSQSGRCRGTVAAIFLPFPAPPFQAAKGQATQGQGTQGTEGNF